MNSPDTAHLEREIETLRERLEEAEDMRRAIAHEEVDAFIVGHSDDDKKVLLLAGAYSRYRQLIDEMQHGTVTISRTGEVLFANQRFAQLLGVPLGELYRVPLAAYVGADDRAAVAALLTTPASDDAGIEVDLLARSGRVRARIAVVSSWEQYATLVVTDLAHERLVEEAQQTVDAIRRGEVEAFVIGGETVMMLGGGARDPYQVLADRIQQGALTLSSANKVIYANDKLARMLGVPLERLLGGEFAASAIPADRPVLRGLMDGKNGGQGEVRLRHADGSSVPMLVSMLPLADGRRMCLVTDLSERKRHQASDDRNRKFLGMLAHEFRNMLSTIHNSVEVLKQQELNAECAKALVLIERQSDRMLELVEDLRRVNPKP